MVLLSPSYSGLSRHLCALPGNMSKVVFSLYHHICSKFKVYDAVTMYMYDTVVMMYTETIYMYIHVHNRAFDDLQCV